MPDLDLDDFIAWLQAAGARRDQLARYRDGAEQVLRQVHGGQAVGQQHVDAAIETARLAGASEQRLVNLGRIGAQLLVFVADRELPPLPPPTLPPATLPPPMAPTTGSEVAMAPDWLPPPSSDWRPAPTAAEPWPATIREQVPAETHAEPPTDLLAPAPARVTDALITGGQTTDGVTTDDLATAGFATDTLTIEDSPLTTGGPPPMVMTDGGWGQPPPQSPARFAPPGGDDEPPPNLELAEVPHGTSRRARLARLSQASAEADGGAVRGTMIDDLEPAAAAPDAGSPRPAVIPPIAPLATPATPAATRRPTSPPAVVGFTGPRPGVLASAGRPGRVVDDKPLPGCVCQRRHAVAADDAWRQWGTVFALATGAIGVLFTVMGSLASALAVSLGMVGLGALFASATVGWRCGECRRWIERRGLDDAQRQDVRVRVTTFAVLGAALTVAAVLMVMKVRADAAERLRATRALQQLERDAPTE